MAKVKIYHPKLDRTVEVNARAAKHHERSGWVVVEKTDPKGAGAKRATSASRESHSAPASKAEDKAVEKSPASGKEK